MKEATNLPSPDRRNGRFFLLFSALLAIMSMIGTDIYLPAFSTIQQDLNTTAALVGMSMSAYFFGTMLTQLVYGPISDFIGRKPILIFGLSIFLLGTLGCIFSETIEWFLLSRFIQAFGVCATAVIWQPIVMDVFSDDEAKIKSTFNFVMSFVGISPALAPLLGGWITETFGWRQVFVFLVLLASLLLLITTFVFKETLTLEQREDKKVSYVFSSFKTLLSSYRFYIYAIAVGSTVGAYMAYLTIVPFSLSTLGYSPSVIGLHFIPLAMIFGLGGAVSGLLGKKFSDAHVLRIGSTVMLAGSLLLAASLHYSQTELTLLHYLLPMGVITCTFGIVIPTGSSVAIQHFKSISGTCSSGMNFITSALAFIATFTASFLYNQYGDNAMTMTMIASSFIGLLALLQLKPEPEMEANSLTSKSA